jgi:hypothetical protein
MATTPFMAHWNSVTLPQFVSVVLIDPVASITIATFHGCACPCIDAVASADTLIVEWPNVTSFMKYVGTEADSITLTAFGWPLVPHTLSEGSRASRQTVFTDGWFNVAWAAL